MVETTKFNGRASFRGESAGMKLTERFTRVAPSVIEYRFTVEDPATWTKPWTAIFTFDKDDEQYQLVEYACPRGQLRNDEHPQRRAQAGKRPGRFQKVRR